MEHRFDAVVITGASSGIGREMAVMGTKFCRIIYLVARRREMLIEVENEIRTRGGNSVSLALDITTPGAVAQIISRVESDEARLDVWINNAGFGMHGDYLQLDFAREKNMIELNVLSLMESTKEAARIMEKQGGGVVLNVASVAAFQPGPSMAVYFASKAFVLNYSEALDEEMRHRQVRVLTLCPGSTVTPFHEIAGCTRNRLLHNFTKMPVRPVAKEAWIGIINKKRIIVPGLVNKILINLPRFLPRCLVCWLTKKMIR